VKEELPPVASGLEALKGLYVATADREAVRIAVKTWF
jgi:hypothetical protein